MSNYSIVLVISLLLFIVGIVWGDSEKKTAWMFFLIPVSIIIAIVAIILKDIL